MRRGLRPFLDDKDHYVPTLRDVARRAEHAELLVAADGELLGTVTFVPAGGPLGEIAAPDETEFRMLAVGPGAQGRGVGTALLRHVLDASRALGKAGVVCSSLPEMRAAHRVYERVGLARRARARLVAGAGRGPARVRAAALTAAAAQCRWLPAQIIVPNSATVRSVSATAKMSWSSITRRIVACAS